MAQSNPQNGRVPETVRFDGRILFLSQDPKIVERQLAGEDIDLDDALPLRTDVSAGPDQVWLASPSTVAASAVAGHIVSFEQLRSRGGGIR